jgi:HD-like signal output (HDOD) protein/GGDEF domain-containing protein
MTIATATTDILEQLVNRAANLYTLPAVALDVLDLTNQERVDAAALTDCIERDPALTAKILRVVNSSLFGLPRQIGDLNHALAMLGAKPLRLLVLGMSLPANLFEDVSVETLNDYWEHAIIKAIACREIAEAWWSESGDEPFTAGLLQDIGQLVLIQQLGDTYINFLDGVADSTSDLRVLEVKTLGFDHASLSAKLLDNWGLPHPMINAIGVEADIHQIQRLSNDSKTLAQILHLAELTARLLTRPDATIQLQHLLDTSREYRRQLTQEDVQDLVTKLSEKVAPFAEALAISINFQEDYQQVLQKAYARLADAAEQAAGELIQENSAQLQRYQQEFSSVFQDVRDEGLDWQAPAEDPLVNSPNEVGVPTVKSDTGASVNTSFGIMGDEPPSYIPLAGPLTKAISSCNQVRCPLSLAIVEYDNYENILAKLGAEATSSLTGRMGEIIHRLVDGEAVCFPTGERQFAILLEDCDRRDAVEWLRHLLGDLRNWLQGKSGLRQTTVTVSTGLASLAVPSKNFPCEELIESAERCLNAAQLQGGDALKSIDL